MANNNPIDAFQINSAREFHRLTTGSRIPQRSKPNNQLQQQQQQQQHQISEKSEKNSVSSIGLINNTTDDSDSNNNVNTHCNNNNPFCKHCGKVIIPAPVATFPIIDTPSICINNEWYILTQRKPILNAQEIENFEKILIDIPVPEMIFGNNKVEIIFKGKERKGQFHLMFNTLDALKLVERNPENLIKVSYANEWFKSRQLKHKNSENVSLEVYKPYDWTYTSKYKGTMLKGNELFKNDDENIHKIPIDKLSSNNPIKFYDDMILYEDELGDNGISILNIKIRVMSNCLLILQRLFIRVDNVLVRIIDTRLYIDFEEYKIIREQKIMQDDYNSIIKKIKGPDPKKWLRDINWCSQNLPITETSREHALLD
jgi:type 2A phosphatase activator TIP41